jgi:hypothetical protein
VYNSCSNIPIFNFFELVKTKDFSLLFEDGIVPEGVTEEDLAHAVSEILTEYNELTKNSALMREYRDNFEIEYLEAKYNFSNLLIAMYIEYEDVEIIYTINRFGWDLNTDTSLMPQLDALKRQLIGIKNQLKIKKSRFIKLYRKNKEEGSEPTNFNLQKQIIYLETGIPLNYKIDIYKDSVERFVYWNEILENKNKATANG